MRRAPGVQWNLTGRVRRSVFTSRGGVALGCLTFLESAQLAVFLFKLGRLLV